MITLTFIVEDNAAFREKMGKCAIRNGWTSDSDISDEEYCKSLFVDFVNSEAEEYDMEELGGI